MVHLPPRSHLQSQTAHLWMTAGLGLARDLLKHRASRSSLHQPEMMLPSQLSSHAPNAATHLPTPSTPPTLYVFLILLFCTSPPDFQCFILPTSVLLLTVLLSPFLWNNASLRFPRKPSASSCWISTSPNLPKALGVAEQRAKNCHKAEL